MLVDDVAMICEGIICKTCVEMDIEKGISPSKGMVPRTFLGAEHGYVGNGWDVVEKYISEQHTHEYNREK